MLKRKCNRLWHRRLHGGYYRDPFLRFVLTTNEERMSPGCSAEDSRMIRAVESLSLSLWPAFKA